jgi:hypothetical protein
MTGSKVQGLKFSKVLAIALAGAFLSVAGGCRVSTGLNKVCNLVRGLPDGGYEYLKEADVQAQVVAGASSTRDIISFGAVECEDLICVRDSSFGKLPDGGVPLVDPDAGAQGYCSRSCVAGNTCPSDNPAQDDGKDKLNCRPLLLDAETLAALRGDGGSGLVGNVTDPYFCARGTVPDAGN